MSSVSEDGSGEGHQGLGGTLKHTGTLSMFLRKYEHLR